MHREILNSIGVITQVNVIEQLMQASWMLLFFVWLAITLFTALMCGAIYAIYTPIKKTFLRTGRLTPFQSKLINTVYILGIFCFTVYQTYYAVFPDLDFYAGEYKYVTMRELPKSAQFVIVNSTYPDFHGDYSSHSQIKLSKTDFKKLVKELQSDHQMVKDTMNIGMSGFDYVLKGKSKAKIIAVLQRPVPDHGDHYLTIHFYNDMQTIFVNVSVT